MNGSEAFAKATKRRGIQRVFSHAGGTISHPLAALDAKGVEVVVAKHEAQAVHMAQGAYRVTGHAQLVLVTSGPGVTNAITGIADAYYDQDAVVVVCGQVPLDRMRGDSRARQMGFQETPTVQLTAPITKQSVLLDYAPDVEPTVFDAFVLAKQARPGPVVLDFPMDVQRKDAKHEDGGYSRIQGASSLRLVAKPYEYDDAVNAVLKAKHPVIVAGRGCLTATTLLRRFAHSFDIPVVSTLPAVGAFPTDDPLYCGMLGHTGTERANRIVAESDVILALGARLDVRQTGTDNDWGRGQTVISVDYDLDELQWRQVRVDIQQNCHVREWLEWAL